MRTLDTVPHDSLPRLRQTPHRLPAEAAPRRRSREEDRRGWLSVLLQGSAAMCTIRSIVPMSLMKSLAPQGLPSTRATRLYVRPPA
jgi:hypothetical protein